MLRNVFAWVGFGCCGALLSACGGPEASDQTIDPAEQVSAVAVPEVGGWGFPLETMDPDIAPGDDFFLYANGRWLAETDIPPTRTGTGFSVIMRERNQERITAIIDDLKTSYPPIGSDEQKIKDLYLSYLDVARIEIAGMAPFEADLERIANIETAEQVMQIMAEAELGIGGLVTAYVSLDAKQPERAVVHLRQSGLGLPDRLFYLGKARALDRLRAGYLEHITTVFELLGKDFPSERAQDVFALETAIAKLHWSKADARNVTRTYNPMSFQELEATAPGIPWASYLAAKGYPGVESLIVREVDAIVGLARLCGEVRLSTWRDYLALRYVNENATYMPQVFGEAHFDFFRRKMRGQRTPRPRAALGISFVNSRLEHAVGEIYVERYVPEDARSQMLDLFANIKAAYKARIEQLDWMSEPTKQAALEKLAAMQGEIGYPEKRQTYDAVEIDAYDLFGNIKRLRANARQWQIDRLQVGLDRSHWTTSPQTVNAFYNHSRNTVFVPAGYVQSPLFDPAADPALNYGAMGAIIGHEIGHGFDDRGAHYDAHGRLANWWSDADKKAFEQQGERLVKQFDEYEALPGLFVNGRLTLGENIGDLAGMQVAYDAYILSLEGQDAPVLDGYTGAQRFFLGRAQARRYKRTEQNTRRRVLSDSHSPMSLRVNGIIRNMDVWYDAFDVGPDDDLYLPPEARVKIW